MNKTTTVTRSALVWGGVVGLALLSIALVRWGERLPAPLPADAPLPSFSAGRALQTLDGLTALGERVAGSESARRAADLLERTLRTLPGVEVDTGPNEQRFVRQYEHTPFPYPLFVYRARNVLARIPGKSREAVLLNAHYDTTGSSVGAGDDAFGVAAIVEAARVLAREAPHERTIILLLNGGEEYGLRGADAFTHHPWARDVRAYLYLDGIGVGKPRVINSTPGHPELLEAYVRAAPWPSANVITQAIFDSASLGADGDHRPLQDAGMAGLSIGCVGALSLAHTALDDRAHVDPSALQALGETTLAVARRLAAAADAAPTDTRRRVYFDLVGKHMISYSPEVALGLAIAALGLAAAALGLAWRRQRIGGGALARALVLGGVAHLVAIVAALLVAVVVAIALGRPMGWYARPWLAGVVFPAAAIAGSLAVRRRWRRRLGDAASAIWVAWASCLVGWAVVLALATLVQAGAGYLPLVWTLALALGLLAALAVPAAAIPIALAAALPGTLLTLGFALPMLAALLEQTAIIPMPLPADLPVAVMLGVPAALLLPGLVVAAHGVEQWGRVALAALGIAVLGAGLLVTQPPFTAAAPRRLAAVHIEHKGRSALALSALDGLPLDREVARVSGVAAARPDWTPILFPFPPSSHEVPAAPPSIDPPTLEVLQSVPQPDGTRRVKLRLVGRTPHLLLLVPSARLVGWSLTAALPAEPAIEGRHVVFFSGPPPIDETIEVHLGGAAPVDVELRAVLPGLGKAHEALLQQLPPHVVLWPETVRARIDSL